MKWPALALCLMTALPLAAQSSTDAARADGKAFGQDKAATAQAAATHAATSSPIPGSQGAPSNPGYFAYPERMARDGASTSASHTGYRTMRESMDRRARFEKRDLDAVIARSRAVANDPLAYTSGMSASGSQGRCVPLPPADTGAARYTATCNTGFSAVEEVRHCAPRLVANSETVTGYVYWCAHDEPGSHEDCARLPQEICRATGVQRGKCIRGYTDDHGAWRCSDPRTIEQYVCTAPVAGWTAPRTTTTTHVTTDLDESSCAGPATDNSCRLTADTCTDASPQTRTIGGVAVTRSCWAWERSYTCTAYTEQQDCTALEQTPGCRFLRDECLTDEPCRTWERLYDCPVPDAPKSPDQFICDGNIYCIDGACETIERQANTEFRDAAVALNAMAQARREFDPANLSLFKGTRETCSSKVFGVLNCCRGRGFPLIPGIQLLVALGCSREEMLLHQRDAQGLCHYVGTYCSSSVLGVCLAKRKAYCCFESKLSRILQVQGRAQIGKPWGKPKKEQCRGFTVEEFARLDLSRMDFSEVYAEFTDAARLPDELQAAGRLQQKIEAFYANANP